MYSHLTIAFFSGLAGGLLYIIGMLGFRVLGISDFSLPLLLGSRLTGTAGFGAWSVGMLIHLLGTGLTGLIYGGFFSLTGNAGWRVGALIGLAHWVIAGFVLGLFGDGPGLPLAPGYYGVTYGAENFVELLLLFLGYGALVGELFERAIAEKLTGEFKKDITEANSPLADSLGQAQIKFENYKRSA